MSKIQIQIPGAKALEDTKTHIYRFQIPSESSNKLYTVAKRIATDEWECECLGWIHKKPGKPRGCKHLRAMLPDLMRIAAENEKPKMIESESTESKEKKTGRKIQI